MIGGAAVWRFRTCCGWAGFLALGSSIDGAGGGHRTLDAERLVRDGSLMLPLADARNRSWMDVGFNPSGFGIWAARRAGSAVGSGFKPLVARDYGCLDDLLFEDDDGGAPGRSPSDCVLGTLAAGCGLSTMGRLDLLGMLLISPLEEDGAP
ncbi:hypothetical protein ACLOJK_003737 [Asimina triloba]